MDANRASFLLIVHPDGGDVLRIVPSALEVTQKSQQALQKAYVGSYVIDSDGTAREILGVEVDGLAGSSLPGWLSWLSATGARKLRLTFASPKDIDADGLRVPLMKFLRSRARVDEWAESQHAFDELLGGVERARSIGEIFACVERANSDTGGLDVLV